jgi:hypothetical protein
MLDEEARLLELYRQAPDEWREFVVNVLTRAVEEDARSRGRVCLRNSASPLALSDQPARRASCQ